MRGDQNAVGAVERVLRRRRLHVDHVQRRACNPTGIDGPVERLRVDDPPAGGVDQECRRLHFCQGRRVDQVLRLLRQRQVQSHEVGLGQEPVEVGRFDAAAAHLAFVNVRVPRQQPPAKSSRLLGNRAPDPPKADDPQRAAKAASHRIGRLRLPHAGANIRRTRVQVAQRVQEQRHCVRGDLVGAVVGHVGDVYARRGRRVDVDIVHANRRLDDRQATRKLAQDLGRDRHIADQQSDGLLTGLDQLRFGRAGTLDQVHAQWLQNRLFDVQSCFFGYRPGKDIGCNDNLPFGAHVDCSATPR